jgi:DNA-binding transcriptional regulator YiaG
MALRFRVLWAKLACAGNQLEKKLNDPSSSAARGERMLRLRRVFGPTQAAFCQRYGFTVTQWSNFENGKAVGHAAAMRLVQLIPGLSLNWIYFASIGDLSVGLARRLGELPPDNDSKTG